MIGPFDKLGKFKTFGWYAIFGYAKLAPRPAHPFVDHHWIEEPGVGVYAFHDVGDRTEVTLIARRALLV